MSQAFARSPRGASRYSAAAEICTALTVAVVPLSLGGVPVWALWPLVAFAALSGVLTCLAARHQGERVTLPLVGAVFAVGAGLCALQLLPLPPGLLAQLSPEAAELRRFALEPLGLPAAGPVSLDPPATFRELAKHLAYALLVVSSAFLARRERSRRRLFLVVAAVGFAVALLGFAHELFAASSLLGLYTFRERPPLLTPFGNPNHLAGFLTLTSTVTLGLALSTRDLRLRAGFLAAYVLEGAALVLSFSRAGIVFGVLAQLGFAVWLVLGRRTERGSKSGRRTLASLALGMLLLGGVSAYLASERLGQELSSADSLEKVRRSKVELWPMFAEGAGPYWRLGMGRGAFEEAFQRHQSRLALFTFTHPENAVLQLWAETGVVFTVLLVGGFLFALWRILRVLRDRVEGAAWFGVAALLLHNLFDFSLEFAGVTATACVLLGLLSRPRELRSRGQREATAVETTPPARRLAPLGLTVAASLLALLALLPGRHTVGLALAELSRPAPNPDAVRDAAVPLLARHPAASSLYAQVASAYASAKPPRLGEALAFVNRALYLRPLDAGSHRIAAWALLRSGRRNQGLLEYRLAYEATPTEKDAVLVEGLKIARGLDELRRVVPEEATALGDAADKLWGWGRREESEALATWALEVCPPDAATERLLLVSARACELKRDFDCTLSQLALAEERAPRSSRPLVERAAVLQRTGRREESVKALEGGVARFPGETELLFALAQAHLSLGFPGRARETLKQASPFIVGMAGRSRLFAAEAETYRAQGAFARALEAYRSAARLAPQQPGYHYEMAQLFEQLDRPTDAIAAVKEGMRRETSPSPEREAWIQRLQQRATAKAAFVPRKETDVDAEEAKLPE